MTDRIDAHQHFWRLARGDYGWLTPTAAAIYRDFMPEDLSPLLERTGIAGTVLVQAAPTEAETEFMLSLADRHGFVRGVVGWTDFSAADAPRRIEQMARHPKLKGLRPMIQDIADDDWMLRRELDAAFRAMIEHGLVLDALVLPRHLDNLLRLLDRYPALRVVVDHCAKPDFSAGRFHDWARGMERIGRSTGALCKLSGLVTEIGPDWTVERMRPHVDGVLEWFGADRLIWGSDWPVSALATDYEAWVDAAAELVSACSRREQEAIFGGTAASFYRL